MYPNAVFRTTKKNLSVLLSLVLVISLTPIARAHANEGANNTLLQDSTKKQFQALTAASLKAGDIAGVPDEGYSAWKEEYVGKRDKDNAGLLGAQSFESSGFIGLSDVQCYVSSNGEFNIGTSSGDCLLYDYPWGDTSETLIRIDGFDYIFSNYAENTIINDEGTQATTVATIDGVEIRQVLSIECNPNSNSSNIVSIRYICNNGSTDDRTVAVRIMLDTMLGDNDGAPFKVRGSQITTEAEYRGASIPNSYQAYESLTSSGMSATGYLIGNTPNSRRPDKVQFAHWRSIVGSSWDYEITPGQSITGDSAVGVYFYDTTLSAYESTVVSTLYGGYDQHSVTASMRDTFNYVNDDYDYDLAVLCAKYASYAYGDYRYESWSAPEGLFYTGSSKTTKYLKEALIRDGYDRNSFDEHNFDSTTEDGATYAFAHKKVVYNSEERDLVAVVIRGTNAIQWKGNMNVTGSSYIANCSNHYSFEAGAADIWQSLSRYIEKNDYDNSMVLIAGHSRGGALGNLLAYNLTIGDAEEIGVDSSAVFAYLFAVPNTTLSPNNYLSNIYNICFEDDFVPNMPFNEWGYYKHGVTMVASASEQSRSSAFFRAEQRSIHLSEGNRNPVFDEAKHSSAMKTVVNRWKNTKAYYDLELYSNLDYDSKSMYRFMHDVVAPAAMGEDNYPSKAQYYAAAVPLLAHTASIKGKSPSKYYPIADLFVEGLGGRKSIDDTHQMFTYYNALTNGVSFNEESYSDSSKKSFIFSCGDTSGESLKMQFSTAYNAAEVSALALFFAQDNNSTLLNWTPSDPSTFDGIFWDEEGRVTSIDLAYTGLSGTLNLSAFSHLEEVLVSGNHLSQLVLPEKTTSILSWLACDGNDLTQLDIDGQPLEFLECDKNYIDVSTIAASASLIDTASYENQRPVQSYEYDDNEVTALKHLLTDETIWDLSASPSEWIGVSWSLIEDKLHVVGLSLADSGLQGTLDLSPYKYLDTLQVDNNQLTAIDASTNEMLVFASFNNNLVSSVAFPESEEIEIIACDSNYLALQTVADLNAGTVISQHQYIDADKDAFDADEVSALSGYASSFGDDPDSPGSWSFVTWAIENGKYHAVSVDLTDSDSVSGDLDLSQFAVLSSFKCANTGVTSVVLPSSVDSIDEMAFNNCRNLTSISIPDEVESIGDYAFLDCSSLVEVRLPKRLKTIGTRSFYCCTSINRIVLPKSLTTVEADAFKGCSSLSDAYFLGDAPQCGSEAFFSTSVDFVAYYLAGRNGWGSESWMNCLKDEIAMFSIISYPTKLQYYLDETIDTTGLTLLYVDDDEGDYSIIDDGFGISPLVTSESGEMNVRISYDSHFVEYQIVVNRIPIQNADIVLSGYDFNYGGSTIEPAVDVAYNGEQLVLDTDYSIDYFNNDYPGLATVEVSGLNKYDGVEEISFAIRDVGSATVENWTSLESDHNYNNYSDRTWVYSSRNGSVSSLRLKFDTRSSFESGYDYLTVCNSSGNRVGTFSGNELSGKTITVTGRTVRLHLSSDSTSTDWGFKVIDLTELIDISKSTISGITDRTYTGAALAQNPVVKYNGKTLQSGKDYTISYKNNVNVGTATVVITGIGIYTGTKSATFKIVAPAKTQMQRLYNPWSGEHFYTSDLKERNNLVKLGWRYEGVGWNAPTTGANVYRLYNPYSGDHHFTTNASEKDTCVRAGWKYEGVGWKSGGSVKVYREYNPYAECFYHNYTASAAEHKSLCSIGWKDEGVGWYGV